MSIHRLTLCFALTVLGFAPSATAQTVWIEGAEEGQGVLRARGNECFVITPYHVVKDTLGDVTIVGPQATRTTAELVRSFPSDLAVLRIKDARSLSCDEWLPLDNFDAMLKTQAGGFLLITERTGGRTRLQVTFAAHDEERIFVRPSPGARQIEQTMSGALLLINGAPGGILLQKSNDEGTGEIYQIDDVMRLTQPFFAVATKPENPDNAASMEPAVATALLDRAVQTRDGSQQGQNKAVAALLAQGYDFANANWSGLSLRGGVLRNGKFSGLVMHAGDLSDADLRGANLQKAGLRFGTMDRTQFGGALLGQVYAPFVSAQGADLTGADLARANFFAGDFRKANFTKAKLPGASLAFADLRGANFDGADLTGAYLTGALLDGATFTGAIVKDTDLQGAVGTWDGLSNAQRSGACRHGILGGAPGVLVLRVDLMERWPSNKYDSGYQFEDLRTEDVALRSFADRSLPLCRTPNDAAAAYRADYPAEMGIYVDREYVQKAGRRAAILDRINSHAKLLSTELTDARVLKGDNREVKAWEASMRAAASTVKLVRDPVLGEDDLTDVLLIAAGGQTDSIDWGRLAQQHFMKEWQSRRKDAGDAARLLWTPFFPQEAPTYADLPSSTPELFRAWTVARAKAAPKQAIVRLRTRVAAGARVELGKLLAAGRTFRADAIAEAAAVPKEQLAMISSSVLVFPEPIQNFVLMAPAGSTAISGIDLSVSLTDVRPLAIEGFLPMPLISVTPAAVTFRTQDGKAVSGVIERRQ